MNSILTLLTAILLFTSTGLSQSWTQKTSMPAGEWGWSVSFAIKDDCIKYLDTNGSEIFIFEPDEEGWDLYIED